jgi:ATP-binding cassette subfamily F protein uup
MGGDGAAAHARVDYLGDFLFPPQRASAPVKTLSGGERNRLLLARLFAQPANLLVLDEPTNDLDIEIARAARGHAAVVSGTLLLVSHDRTFLDNVVTQTLVAEGRGTWKEYVGGYSDWLAQRPRCVRAQRPPARSRRRASRRRGPRARNSRSRSSASSTRCPRSWKRSSASSTRSPSA